MPRYYTLNENYFSVIDTEEKAYWLGFLLADGNVSKGTRRNSISIGLAIKDKDHLIKFKKCLETTYAIKYGSVEVKGREYPTARITLYSKRMKNDLTALGCGPQKSNTAIFCDNIKSNLIRHYIRGYFDGDGSLSSANTQWRIDIIGTEDVTTKILKIFKDLTGSTANLTRRRNSYYCYIGGINYVKTIMDWLYYDASIFLDRKYMKYIELQQSVFFKKINEKIYREKLSIAMKGKKLSNETKQKMSLASKGKSKSDEHKKKMSVAAKGKRKTNEHKQKISQSNKKRFETDLARKLISGENATASKLDNKTVLQLRSEFEMGASRRELALKYNISLSTVKDIIRRKTWKYI